MAEQMGNVLLLTRCLNYLAIIYRRREDHQHIARMSPQVIARPKERSLVEYRAAAEANIAWFTRLEGDMAVAKVHGHKALAIWQSLPIIMLMP